MAKVDKNEIRIAAENDLLTFIRLVAPHRVLGHCHEELIRWWTRDDAKSHQLVLLPRDHQKSAMVAYRVAWEITRNPAITILYISSTSGLAEKQLKFIQDILTSKKYSRYWPEMVNKQEGKREKWTGSEMSVDHPMRKEEGVRDPTVFTAGLTTSITGAHCNVAVLDDVVVKENAYTEEGRRKTQGQYSLLASIETTDAQEWVVGTRYHPKDLYGALIEMTEEEYSEEGDLISRRDVYETFERAVEDMGDGSGEYLWPRMQRYDGRWFGFSRRILARKRAQYLDRTQFHAQYYNNPNDPENEVVSSDYFQYYDRRFLEMTQGKWFFRDKPLNIFAAIDFAFSQSKKADYTALVVIGIDPDSNIYILDIDRFKTNKISEYFDKVMRSHIKWGFRKLAAEVTIAQDAIVEELKNTYIRKQGLALSIEKHKPTRHQGTKEERLQAILNPRYENGNIWHYRGGLVADLEQELKMANPPHDDMKDALASAINVAIPPKHSRKAKDRNVVYHPKFGGVSFGR